MCLLSLLTKKMEYRRVYRWDLFAPITVALCDNKITVWKPVDCKLQVKAKWFWITVRNYRVRIATFKTL